MIYSVISPATIHIIEQYAKWDSLKGFTKFRLCSENKNLTKLTKEISFLPTVVHKIIDDVVIKTSVNCNTQ